MRDEATLTRRVPKVHVLDAKLKKSSRLRNDGIHLLQIPKNLPNLRDLRETKPPRSAENTPAPPAADASCGDTKIPASGG